jgi:tetratricopeptide (TPR) repeat protein
MYQWAGRIAAGLTLLIVGFLTIQFATVSPERLYEERITSESPYLGLSNRSMEDREDTLADQVRVEYQFGNYEEVIRLYGELENPTFAETFRAGYAYLQQEKTEQAIYSFQQVIQDEDAFMIKDKAEYYLALAYLQDGQIETAVNMLERIHESDDHIYEDSLSSFYLWRLRLLKMKY